MKKIYIDNDERIELKQFDKLPIIDPDFTSVSQLKGDKNVLEYAFKCVLITNQKDNG
jgi:hypothetical protein